MEPAEIRTRTQQIADDLTWLEEYAASKPDGVKHRSPLRLAAALMRNVIGPYLDGQGPLPLHVAVVGGAGAGKSTVANLLVGEMVAESNPQAGFTRHPIAFGKSDVAWPATLGFLGPLKRLETHESARLDEDVYQFRRLAGDKPENSLLEKYVVWDCPDMTTWAASHYVPRLIEAAGLADVLVYVASDERDNDEVPTEFLRLFLEAGKTVVVVLVKMRESDAAAFIAHFRKEVGEKMPGPALSVLPIPQLTAEQLADPIAQAARFRIPIVNQVAVLAGNPAMTRRIGVANAWKSLTSRQDRLLAVGREDVEALDTWRRLVQEGEIEFGSRYRKEYLSSERFRRFDEALVRLMEMLELPKVGRFVSQGLNILRMPYTFVKGWVKRDQPVPAGVLAEKPVLDAAFRGWIDGLRKEVAARKTQNALWAHLHEGFQADLGLSVERKFQESSGTFHDSLNAEVDRTARALLEDLERKPIALNTLRGAKFALDAGAIGGTLLLGPGLIPWAIFLVPLSASVSQYLVDLLGEGYVSVRREETRSRQQSLFTQQLASPLSEWLIRWPTSDGSVHERLHVILRRLPANLTGLDPVIRAKLT